MPTPSLDKYFDIVVLVTAISMPREPGQATVVVNPTSGSPVPEGGVRVVLDDLAGKRVGFFTNNKPNAEKVLERIEELLRRRFGIVARHYAEAGAVDRRRGVAARRDRAATATRS